MLVPGCRLCVSRKLSHHQAQGIPFFGVPGSPLMRPQRLQMQLSGGDQYIVQYDDYLDIYLDNNTKMVHSNFLKDS
jgi:hypothetical protein